MKIKSSKVVAIQLSEHDYTYRRMLRINCLNPDFQD